LAKQILTEIDFSNECYDDPDNILEGTKREKATESLFKP